MTQIPPDGIFDKYDNTYVDGLGRKISHVHPPAACHGRPCVIHNPSDHAMRLFPTHLRVPGPFDIKPMHMERICPHGVGHPDPDDLAYQKSVGEEGMGVHGCDGCCAANDQEPCRCVYPDKCFCTPEQKALRNPLLDEVDEEGRRAFRKPQTGEDVLHEANLSTMTAMVRSLQDDVLDRDDEIANLREQLDRLDDAYLTVRLSRDHWRTIAMRALGDPMGEEADIGG